MESLDAKIFKILKPLIEERLEIESKTAWYEVTHSDELHGDLDDRTRKIFFLNDYDINLTPRLLAEVIQYKFLAKCRPRPKIVNGKKKMITYFVFEKSMVKLLSVKYHTDYPL